MLDQLVEFLKRVLVEQELDSLARDHLAGGVLLLDAGCAAAVFRLLFELAQLIELRLLFRFLLRHSDYPERSFNHREQRGLRRGLSPQSRSVTISFITLRIPRWPLWSLIHSHATPLILSDKCLIDDHVAHREFSLWLMPGAGRQEKTAGPFSPAAEKILRAQD